MRTKHILYRPNGVCSQAIDVTADENDEIQQVFFIGGCNGNLKAIGRLVEGKDAKEVADILRGNTCGMKGTSCADQLAKAIDEYVS